MLKSTYRQAAPDQAISPLPSGWTEHKAPTGHAYYYHAETQTSTYTRPTEPSEEPLQIDYGATEPDHVVRASMQVMDEFNRNNPAERGHFTGGRSYQDHSRRRGNQGDRPKSKAPIPNCEPWLLVKSKLGRRFVHNTETKQSLWKFPQDVMMAVIEMDRLEWEAKKKAEEHTKVAEKQEAQASVEGAKAATPVTHQPHTADYDSDSYEEVEVTDNEADEDTDPTATKRPRLSQEQGNETTPPSGPVEFDEDDIAWQLAQMEGGDYSDGYEDDVGHEHGNENEDEDEGLPLTASDNIALFRSLLDDSSISPYSVFEKVIEDISIVEDSRYVALPNISARKEVFVQWSKDRIAEAQALKKEQQAAQSNSASRDPRVVYLRLLQKHATPKLYWPEFKRKFKKEPAMKDLSLQDKDREKLYREYISKLKLPEMERRKDLAGFLKTADIPKDIKDIENLPLVVLKDVRFYLIEEHRRDEIVRTFLGTVS